MLHVVGKPAAVWLGFVVAWNFGKWQLLHAVERPVYTPLVWHELHCRPAWPAVNGNVDGWLNVAPSHVAVVWHEAQLVLYPAVV